VAASGDSARARLLALLLAVAAAACGEAPEQEPEASGPAVELVFLGDTGFGEGYNEPRDFFGDDPEARYHRPFAELGSLLAPEDHVIANLEQTLVPESRSHSPLAELREWLHRGDPERGPAALAREGVDAVSLANNHSMDYGAEGLRRTREALARHGIDAFGAGADAAEAGAPWVRRFASGGRELEVAVFGAFEYRRPYDRRYGFYAGPERPGVAFLTALPERIRRYRAEHPRAFVVAFVHWGQNYAWRDGDQREGADALLGAGADLVIGHGAHLLQEFERRRGRWVLYGIGNFVFVTIGRYDRMDAHPYAAVARLSLRAAEEGLRSELRLYPIVVDNRVTRYRPRPVSDDELEHLLLLLEQQGVRLAGVRRGRDARGAFLHLPMPGAPAGERDG